MEIRIGFIGFGAMAQALAEGFVKSGKISGKQITANAAHYDRLVKNAERLGINPAHDAEEVVQNSDMIIIAVKPNVVETALSTVKDQLSGKLVVSIASGWDCARLAGYLPKGTHYISAIPNTPVAVNAGILIIEKEHTLNETELKQFTEVFETEAKLEWIDPSSISVAETIAGCAPAFTAMYMEALADAGVKHGLARAEAYRLAAQMLVGTGTLYLEKQEHPGKMKDDVCSPGGSTIRGVSALEEHGFRGAVIAAVDAVEHK
jgi:pyrroline-5-carboxylate reductase